MSVEHRSSWMSCSQPESVFIFKLYILQVLLTELSFKDCSGAFVWDENMLDFLDVCNHRLYLNVLYVVFNWFFVLYFNHISGNDQSTSGSKSKNSGSDQR